MIKKRLVIFNFIAFIVFAFNINISGANIDTSKFNNNSIFVKSIKNLKPASFKNSAVFGDFISVKVNNLDSFLNEISALNSCSDIISDSLVVLYINGIRTDIPAITINKEDSSIVFDLNRKSQTLTRLYCQFKYINSKLVVKSISIGSRDCNKMLKSEVKNYSFRYVSTYVLWFAGALVLIIIFFFSILVTKTSLIKESNSNSCFSLAQSQMAFWTIIVSASFIYIWAATGKIPEVSLSTLVLLGISISTIAGSKMVTYASKNTTTICSKSNGFWIDILSDNDSINIHRFQMVLWTLIIGVVFLQKVINKQQMPDFNENLLILMGISSGSYVLLKNSENKNIVKENNNTKEQIVDNDKNDVPAIG